MFAYRRDRGYQTYADRQKRLLAKRGVEYTPPVITPMGATWLAAMIDGEGCISLHSHKKRSPDKYLFPIVAFHNTDVRLIDRFVELVGAEWCTTRKRKAREGHRHLKSVTICRAAMADVLKSIRPYLIGKGEQADIVIRFCAIHNTVLCKAAPPPEFLEMFQRMAVLNKRGKQT